MVFNFDDLGNTAKALKWKYKQSDWFHYQSDLFLFANLFGENYIYLINLLKFVAYTVFSENFLFQFISYIPYNGL